jgi:hypothetical protein
VPTALRNASRILQDYRIGALLHSIRFVFIFRISCSSSSISPNSTTIPIQLLPAPIPCRNLIHVLISTNSYTAPTLSDPNLCRCHRAPEHDRHVSLHGRNDHVQRFHLLIDTGSREIQVPRPGYADWRTVLNWGVGCVGCWEEADCPKV